jgi:hypothetical protein
MEAAVQTFSGGASIASVCELSYFRSYFAVRNLYCFSTFTMSPVKRSFQTLPRHLRRRTMSHNLYRIPLRLRESAAKEVFYLIRSIDWNDSDNYVR